MLGKYFDIRIKSTMSTKDENNPENGLNKAEQGVNVQGIRRAKGGLSRQPDAGDPL